MGLHFNFSLKSKNNCFWVGYRAFYQAKNIGGEEMVNLYLVQYYW